MDCKVPFERRYIFAGLADRMSTFGQARNLWLHWGRPTLAAYAGGHVGILLVERGPKARGRCADRVVPSSLDPFNVPELTSLGPVSSTRWAGRLTAQPTRDAASTSSPSAPGTASARSHTRGHEVGAGDDAEADPILLRQHGDVEPRPVGDWPKRVETHQTGAGHVEGDRRSRHVGKDEVVHDAMVVGDMQGRVQASSRGQRR
jgi:hypothetical protein